LEGKDNITDIFSDKLGNYEAKVNPELWGKVASQLGTTTVVPSTGVSVLTKWLIGISVSAAAITTAVIVMNTAEVDKLNKVANTPVVTDNFEKEEVEQKELSSIDAMNNTHTSVATASNEGGVNTSSETREEELIIDTQPLISITASSTSTPSETSNNGPSKVTNTHVEKQSYPVTTTTNTGGELDSIIEDSIVVDLVQSQPTLTITQYTNVFSPNGDRTNDEFSLEVDGVDDFYIIVVNDRGEAVFKSDNTEFVWDGRDFRDEPVPNGNYVYMLSGKDEAGNPIAQTKSLTILR